MGASRDPYPTCAQMYMAKCPQAAAPPCRRGVIAPRYAENPVNL